MMKTETGATLPAVAAFVTGASAPPGARLRAATALLDTVGVTLAGALEPASRAVQDVIAAEGGDACTVLGSALRSTAPGAALANGTAAHALDYDDMCFVSLAHPSAPLVPALLAAGELSGASGSAILDAYVMGFEVEARLGRVMNPRHYQRGWHCTSTLGAIGAAAAASRVMGLDAGRTCHALAIAASEASGLKENFGTMVKPLHAGLAARDGVLAALLARSGLTASERALDGPQGFLQAMDSERTGLDREIADLGARWELLDTGITVKLYPSCAATHPMLDALLALRARGPFSGDDVDRIEIEVDAITPTVLIHERPSTGLEGKFSMPFCAAAAVVDGRVGIETFDAARVADTRIASLMPRIAMQVDPALGADRPPLTQVRVRVHLRNGRILSETADGARGYPDRPASDAELDAKFLSCATRAISPSAARHALDLLRTFDRLDDVRALTAACG
jgi:2-methylcitrate dehydratase PrpD